MNECPRVALMIDASTVYGRRLLEGITKYLRWHRPWSILLEQREVNTIPPSWLRTWRGDGVISRWSSPRVIESLVKSGLAAVDLSDRRPSFGIPRINSDDAAIGQIAAAHLLERGFHSFAYCGFSGERSGLTGARRRFTNRSVGPATRSENMNRPGEKPVPTSAKVNRPGSGDG